MSESEPQVHNWFGRFSTLPPRMVELMRPRYDTPLLSTPQKELIVKVMNELAMRDNPLETAAEELKDEVYLKSNAVRTIDNMSRQLDFLAQQDDVVSQNAACQGLIEQIQGLLQGLDNTIRTEADYSGHVDDLLLLLRGVLLIKEMYMEKVMHKNTTISVVDGRGPLDTWVEFSQKRLNDLETKTDDYALEVSKHEYAMPFVSDYVARCAEVLPGKLDELAQARNAYRLKFENELKQSQTEEPFSKRPRVGPKDPGSLGEEFIARLRL